MEGALPSQLENMPEVEHRLKVIVNTQERMLDCENSMVVDGLLVHVGSFDMVSRRQRRENDVR